MASVSEEISAKVAGLLFEQIIRALDYGTDVGKDYIKLFDNELSKGSEKLENLMKQIKDKKVDEELWEVIERGGELSLGQIDEIKARFSIGTKTVKIPDHSLEKFEKLMQENKITYAKINMREDNCRMFVFLDTASKEVQKFTNIIMADQGLVSELPYNLFKQAGNMTNLKEITNLDNAELEMFRHYARNKGFLYTVIPGDNNNTVVVDITGDERRTSTAKSNAVTRTMTELGWALTGRMGARVREQIEYHLAGRTKIIKSMDEAEKELFIVSKNNPSQFVHITNKEFEIYKDGNLLSKEELTAGERSEFEGRCLSACETIPNPVLLTKDEFEEGATRESLADKRTMQLFTPDFDEAVERYMMEDMVSLSSRGLREKQKENPNISPWNEDISYSEFAAYEDIANAEVRESREIQFDHFKDAAFYSNRHFETYDHSLSGDIDVIIENAKQKAKARAEAAYQARQAMKKEPKEESL